MDPAGEKKIKPLNGCIFEIHIETFSQSFFFEIKDNRVSLLAHAKEATVTLSGSLAAMIKLAFLNDRNMLFKRRELGFAGDAVRAQQIQTFMRNVKIDWEALLAEVVGDVPAQLIGSGLLASWTWGKQISQSFKTDLEEFIKYELRLLPSRAAARRQFHAIDQLRLATDRFEAKLKTLKSKKKSSAAC